MDFPYLVSRGFSAQFLALENRLCAQDSEGNLLRSADRSPLLECMCGRVLTGRVDPSAPFFTERSFWTNSTSDLMAQGIPPHPENPVRGYCHTAGYESVALIPIGLETQMFGLFQCNDRRRDRFTLESIRLLEELAAGAANLLRLSMI